MREMSPYPGAPRWVKVLIVIIGVALLLLLAMVVGLLPGDHGPGRHRTGEPTNAETRSVAAVTDPALRP